MSISVGLDISKSKIDVFYADKHSVIINEKSSIEKFFQKLDKTSKIVMEATGKYHRLAHRSLTQLGFEVMVINPYQSKHFAKALNLICKTDKVDAKMLSMYGEKLDFKVTQCCNEKQEELQDLSRYLDDLQEIRHGLEMRKSESDGFIKESLETTLLTLKEEINNTEEKLRTIIKSDGKLNEKLNILQSIPGVGEKTAIYLICTLKELGTLNKREIVALAGLAPINNDSGNSSGKRHVRGGRRQIRAHLYMPILGAATQHNPKLKKFYTGMVSRNKPKKVALTACMRKLIVWANSMIEAGEYWKEN